MFIFRVHELDKRTNTLKEHFQEPGRLPDLSDHGPPHFGAQPAKHQMKHECMEQQTI